MATFLLWADFLGSPALGSLQGHDWPATLWAGFLDGRIPGRIFAIWIGVA